MYVETENVLQKSRSTATSWQSVLSLIPAQAFVQLNRPVESPAMAIPMSVPVSSLPSTADDQVFKGLGFTEWLFIGNPGIRFNRV